MVHENREWYLSHDGSDPIGPVEGQVVVHGIEAGKVPFESQVCEIGSSEWVPLVTIEQFAKAVRQKAPPPPLPPQSCDNDRRQTPEASPQHDAWLCAYPGRDPTGPHTEAELVHAIATGQIAPTAVVRRVGEHQWCLIYEIPPFSQCWPQHLQHVAAVSVGNPPVGHIVFLLVVGVGGAILGLFSLNLLWIGFGAITVIVYADAWLAGVRRTEGVGGLLNMSPLGWSVSVLLFSAVALPLYVWKRSSAPLKGSTLTHVVVILGAIGFAGLLAIVLIRMMLIGPKGADLGYVRDGHRDDLVVPSFDKTPSNERYTAAKNDSKWAMTCPPNTTWQAFREQAKRAWTEETKYKYPAITCGALTIHYHYSRAAGNQLDDRFELIVYYPHGGHTSSALTKKMIDDMFPNLGAPVRSVGSCNPAASALTDVAALGPDAVRDFSATIAGQGGYRGAVFESEGTRVAVTPGPWARSRQYPDRVVFYLSEWERKELDSYPPIPWEATAPCSVPR